MENIKVKLLSEDAKLPTRSHPHDAGLDLYASEDLDLITTGVISTGVAVQIPEGYVGLVWPRSGLSAKHGIDVLAGVIDHGYTGEIKVCLSYLKDNPLAYEIKKGDRIAQLLIQKIETPSIEQVESFEETERGDSGFGSTGS